VANDELLVETEPEDDRDAPRPPIGAWPAIACLVLAMLIWFGYQAWNLQREYGQLRVIHAGQEGPLEQARKRQAQLETIARRVYTLAQAGNPGATLIVQELARRGVTISPDAPPAAAPAPGAPTPAPSPPPK
jgi:hypothetical protein